MTDGQAQPALGVHQVRALLDLAARHAVTARGRVEPNPMVGCVLIAPGPGAPRVIGVGHHRVFGRAHAEVEAIADARARGHGTAGATALVTLEPCNHHGKQPPCTEAILRAGVRRVVCARADPNPLAAGGADRLRAAGVEVVMTGASVNATRLCDPFVKLVRTDLPWVCLKWAQTIDGRLVSASGQSQWISGPRARARVHRLRGVSDAVITGLGTLRADRPRLTPRQATPRRRPARVVIDARLACAAEPGLIGPMLADAGRFPVLVVCGPDAPAHLEAALVVSGVGVVRAPGDGAHGRVDLRAALAILRRDHGVCTALVEGGPALAGAMVRAGLADELLVFVGPMALAEAGARSLADERAGPLAGLGAADRYELLDARRIGPDAQLLYRRPLDRAEALALGL
ncbi:MAG: bifunctional diaminohydroxyphosphoribosylaminopyrimidine deaminase/5-amino-6-(5-phosphoribosylamino)uracil reductase RibD [Isosphaera sp.]|nr:bifunctional diaminohydroxyphosphoribosylaminopyrimidine deaminase/5-amino-6-(5-phosphoribosylamino)uracil reductase RibD [Isosphaera sp.]